MSDGWYPGKFMEQLFGQRVRAGGSRPLENYPMLCAVRNRVNRMLSR